MQVRFGMIVTDGRGKAGGQFIKKSRGGHVLMNLTVPTKSQAIVQNRVLWQNTVSMTSWNSLTTAEREEWGVIGSNLRRVNKFGEEVTLTGREAFLKVNIPVQTMSFPPIPSSSFNYTPPDLVFVSCDIDIANEEVVLSYANGSGFSYIALTVIRLPRESSYVNTARFKRFFTGTFDPLPGALWIALRQQVGVISSGDHFAIAMQLYNESGIPSFREYLRVRAS